MEPATAADTFAHMTMGLAAQCLLTLQVLVTTMIPGVLLKHGVVLCALQMRGARRGRMQLIITIRNNRCVFFVTRRR